MLRRLGIFLAVALVSTPSRAEEKPPEPVSLKKCVALALEHNFQIRLSELERRNAQDDFEVARAVFDPVFAFGGTRSATRSAAATTQLDGAAVPETESARFNFGLEQRLPTGGSVSLGNGASSFETNSQFSLLNPAYNADYNIALRQPLLQGAGWRMARMPILQAQIGIGSASLENRRALFATLQEVELRYWDVSLARLEREATELDLQTSKNLVEEVQVRIQAGLSTRLDELQARTGLVGRQQRLIVAEQNEAAKGDALLEVLGETRFTGRGLRVSGQLPIFGAPWVNESLEVNRARASNPEYLLSMQALKSRKLSVEQARNQVLPRLDVTARGGYSGLSDGYSRAYDRAARGDGRDWLIGLEVQVPWGLREERARLRQAKTAEESAALQVAQTEQRLVLAVRAACRALGAAHEQVKVAQLGLTLSEEQFGRAKSQFEEGLVEFREVITSQQTLAAARIVYYQARMATVRADLELSRLNGTLPARNGLVLQEPKPR
jgi:outer membrane protein TolC